MKSHNPIVFRSPSPPSLQAALHAMTSYSWHVHHRASAVAHRDETRLATWDRNDHASVCRMCTCTFICMYIDYRYHYVYIYIHILPCIYIYTHVYIYRMCYIYIYNVYKFIYIYTVYTYTVYTYIVCTSLAL